MKTIQLAVLLIIGIGFSACNIEDDEIPMLSIEAKQVNNLYAPQNADFTTNPPKISGDFIKFDFSTGATTTSTTDWDIAVRGTTIIVNGGETTGLMGEPERTGNAGAYVENSTFANVTNVTASLFLQDSTAGLAISLGSGNGWYTYNRQNHSITATPGKVIVFRTADNKYAKVEILSYYKDSPTTISSEVIWRDSRYYTFRYVYQPNEGLTTFEQ